ncbi:DUF1660 family phage protein [Lactococcus lactis]|uniref:DUF1660 family phage protein n=1 Tax=Lactococcus lactis TaxID=1358 RepID=UPI001651CCF4|nr:DUF1660 family phage protein [Lactococcus lactis]QNL91303.1 hypothetical protein HUG14_08050 [Lactococcus lactis]
MKLLCKLHLHKYVEKCERCGKTVIETYNALGTPFVINRSDLDESENVFEEEK